MFTKCPQCHTAFRVTAAMLEVAQGRVRCGRCGEVFNALSDFLQAAPAAAAPVEPVEPVAADSPPVFEELPESILEEVFIEAHPDSAAGDDDLGDLEATGERLALTDDAFEDDSTAVTAEHEIIDINTGEFEVELEVNDAPEEAITLEGQSISIVNEATGEFRTHFALEESEAAEADVEPAIQASAKVEAKVRMKAEAQRQTEAVSAAPVEFSPADFAALTVRRAQPATSPRGKALWIAGSAVLGLSFAVQIVHFNRETLVRNAFIGPALIKTYALFGLELSPAWNLDAYQIRQWGASADAGADGLLKVRASVFNGADRAQPFPVLRLTLQDRFGGRVGSRDLEPAEYLRSAGQAPRLLGAGQRVDAEIAILDPGKDAVGFEIDVCLRGAHNSVTCANDAQQKSG